MKQRNLLFILLTMALAVAAYIIYSSYTEHNIGDLKLMTQQALKPKYDFSIYGEANNRLREPMDVALGKEGHLYVADAGNSRIAVFDERGGFLFAFGQQGEGKLFYPTRLAVNHRGEVLVIDAATKEIKLFDQKGRFLKVLNGFQLIENPGALALDDQGRIYLTDLGKNKVFVFDDEGVPLREIGKETLPPGFHDLSLEEGRLNFPNGIALARKGEIWVVDSNNARVQVFDQQGRVKAMINYSAKQGSKFSLPRAIAFDRDGSAFVADTLGHKIYVFKNNGEPLFSFGAPGLEEGKLFMPNGIAIDSRNRIFIAEKGAHRVSVFHTPVGGKLVSFGEQLKPVFPLVIITTFLALSSAVLLRRQKRKLSSFRQAPKPVLSSLGVLHTIDLLRCHMCGNCIEACRKRHGEARFERFSGEKAGPNLWSPLACRQCSGRYCLRVCPKGAIQESSDGMVTFINENCVGCGACAKACPIGAIKLVLRQEDRGNDGANPGRERKVGRKAVKCDLCYGYAERACEYNCPMGALKILREPKL